jgi:hypothetical protein
MISFWDDAVAEIDPNKPAPMVKYTPVFVETPAHAFQVSLNFGVAVGSTPASLNVQGLDLSPLENFILRNGLTWWTRL